MAEDTVQFNKLASIYETMAVEVAKQMGMDPASTVMALGFAATKIIFKTAGRDPDTALTAVEAFRNAALESMADMISGQETEHGSRQ